MACLETTFLIDYLNGEEGAERVAKELEERGEILTCTPPALSELLFGAHMAGGAYLQEALELASRLTLLPFDLEAAQEAGAIYRELHGRGRMAGAVDIMIAAICKRHRERLITRDTRFSEISGLVVETY
jgi:predicted nucleic acid-binding protein